MGDFRFWSLCGLIWVGWRYHADPGDAARPGLLHSRDRHHAAERNAADLAGAFGGAGSQTAFGPRGAATFLSRATTWCAIVFMMTSLTLSVKRDAAAGVSTRLDSRADAAIHTRAGQTSSDGACEASCSRGARTSADSGSSEVGMFCYNLLALGFAVVAELADAPA